MTAGMPCVGREIQWLRPLARSRTGGGRQVVVLTDLAGNKWEKVVYEGAPREKVRATAPQLASA